MQISPLLPTMSLFLLYQGPVQKHVFVAFTSCVSQVLSVYSFSLLLCPFYFYSLKRSVPQPVSTRGFHVTWRRSCITSVSAKHLHHKSLFFSPLQLSQHNVRSYSKTPVNTLTLIKHPALSFWWLAPELTTSLMFAIDDFLSPLFLLIFLFGSLLQRIALPYLLFIIYIFTYLLIFMWIH